jgi:hypothetical protein
MRTRESWVFDGVVSLAVAILVLGAAGLCFGEQAAAVKQVTNVASTNLKPPSDAIVLFDGKNADAWVMRRAGEPCKWIVEGGIVKVGTGTGDIVTKQKFTDFQLHVEFRPRSTDANATGQGRGNSGVYFQGLYEVQVLDSYGLDSQDNDCGGIYKVSRPMVNACLKPEEWQSYDILFFAPRFDESGKMTVPARISVLQNGVWIQQNAEAWKRTTASMNEKEQDEKKPGPILLQDHGNPVEYRNIWIRPLGPTTP